MHLRVVLTVCTFLALLGGCATMPKQAFNPGANTHVRTVALLEPKDTPEYEVVILNHPGQGFGLIGGLIAAAEISSKSTTFTKMMKDSPWMASNAVADEVAKQLQASGYKVVRKQVPRENFGLLKEYRPVAAEAAGESCDALLDLSVSLPGYVANSHAADYMPSLRLLARLVSTKDDTVLFNDAFVYGTVGYFSVFKPVVFAADSRYHFKNFDALTQGPAIPLEGLQAGVPLLAKTIAQALRHDGLMPAVAGEAPKPKNAQADAGTSAAAAGAAMSGVAVEAGLR